MTSDHRLLPRFQQAPLVERRNMVRQQARALVGSMEGNDEKLPLREALTKPGDPLALRGIPAIGRSVSGAIGQTDPARETVRRITQRERLSERTAL